MCHRSYSCVQQFIVNLRFVSDFKFYVFNEVINFKMDLHWHPILILSNSKYNILFVHFGAFFWNYLPINNCILGSQAVSL